MSSTALFWRIVFLNGSQPSNSLRKIHFIIKRHCGAGTDCGRDSRFQIVESRYTNPARRDFSIDFITGNEDLHGLKPMLRGSTGTPPCQPKSDFCLPFGRRTEILLKLNSAILTRDCEGYFGRNGRAQRTALLFLRTVCH